VVFLHVSEQETASKVNDFAVNYELESLMLLDERGAVGRTYGLRGTPTTYFINANGVIEDAQLGYITLDWINAKMALN
jgi:hypothetical protein